MDTFELKATVVEGLWEIARLDEPSSDAPDNRVSLLANWLHMPVIDRYWRKPIVYCLPNTGELGWHLDNLGLEFNYILIMCHKNPTTEFSNCPSLVCGANSLYSSFIPSRDDLLNFKAEVGTVYLVSNSVVHRAPSNESTDRPFSRFGINWPREIYDQTPRSRFGDSKSQ